VRIIAITKNDKNLFIKLLIFCIRNLYGACSRFYHKIFDSAKEKHFDCSFLKFWGAEISTDYQNNTLQKKGKKAEKSKKKS
jgi:hypothetical protein